MTPEQGAALSEIAKNITVVALLLFALYGGHLGLYVWRRQHDEMVRQYEERLNEARLREAKQQAEIEWWQRLTLRATDVADGAVRELTTSERRQAAPPG